MFKRLLVPNQLYSKKAMAILIAGWMIAFLSNWQWTSLEFIPRPLDVLAAFPDLITKRELIYNLWQSLKSNAVAMTFTTAISLLFAYGSCIAIIRPASIALANMRYLGLAGFSVLFTVTLHTQDRIKVGLLTLSITGYFLRSMFDVIEKVTREQKARLDFNGRTLGMNEWQVLWYCVIRETLDQAFDIFRQCNAMGWSILTLLETMYRTGGGVGVMMAGEEKHFIYRELYGVQVTIFLTGLTSDLLIGVAKGIICPHTRRRTKNKQNIEPPAQPFIVATETQTVASPAAEATVAP